MIAVTQTYTFMVDATVGGKDSEEIASSLVDSVEFTLPIGVQCVNIGDRHIEIQE